ncbi:MAG TPA: GNAT family N-acetyltransferase [Candidatus Binatia bacterium]|jgi:RimJ/RimL family protein N-acetyltransferase|nr:GNAT family N-acetyltransferase [Candidatus Binatia bacterium]
MGATAFETERLVLYRWERGQERAWFAIFGEPEVTRFTFGAPLPDLEASCRGLESTIRKSEQDKPLGWWAVLEKVSGEIIGTVGLNPLPERRAAELGYHSRRDVWGKRYATEVTHAMVSYGVTHGRCERIIAFIDAENSAARRVLEKSGFHSIGTVEHGGRQAERFEREQSKTTEKRGES